MNNAFIICLAYPETVVRMSTEWFGPLLSYIGIGKKNYVRAGHAALVLVSKESGILQYYDFGRYITPHSFGRVRSAQTDYELDFKLKAKIVGDTIENLDEILSFLATNPKLTHGEGNMLASVSDAINYDNALKSIRTFSEPVFVNYSAFKSGGTNCARFVTSVLIEGCNDFVVKKRLKQSQWFTPSTASNVVLLANGKPVYKVSTDGTISEFKDSVSKLNRQLFLDKLSDFKPNLAGNLHPVQIKDLSEKAQWISGIGSGAWFEIYALNEDSLYRCKRLSPNGTVDVDGVFTIDKSGFNIFEPYTFNTASNCNRMFIEQRNYKYTFAYLMPYVNFNLRQKVQTA